MSTVGETTDYVLGAVLPAAFGMLPARMASHEATAMLLAIGLQESAFQHRRQMKGPARGFWQFERGGATSGVLFHPVTRPFLLPVLATLRYQASVDDLWEALPHNDILAAVMARLLLYTERATLPTQGQEFVGWSQYLNCWRPGKPRPLEWEENWREAWLAVKLVT